MKKTDNISYASECGFRGEGDLFLPEGAAGSVPAMLLIHGGGWMTMDRTSIYPIAVFFAGRGWAVYCVNYRLLGDAPWPACGDDCIRAAEFLLSGKHPAFRRLDRERIAVAGASAGGHLAMMTGFRLPSEKVRCIISMAGPSDLKRMCDDAGWTKERMTQFFGRKDFLDEDLGVASPVVHIRRSSPRLYCIHSTNDRLVPFSQSKLAVENCGAEGVKADLISFDGPGGQHGFWADGDDELPDRCFTPEFEKALLSCDGLMTAWESG